MRQFYTGLLLLLIHYGYAQVTCDDEFLLVGDAVEFGDCIRLTPASPAQQGCAWFPEQIDFTQPFTHSMTVNFGTVNANGADGICMIYQTNNTSICGIGGGGIGMQGIPNSFIIEMDTWDNGPALDDIPNDHIAIDVNGDNTNAINGPFDLGNIEDGNDHTVDFTWDPSTNSYLVRFDGNLVLSGTYDIINLCFGGSTTAYWGFSSSTGAATNVQQICPEMPPEVIADAGADLTLPCAGASLTLDGTGSDFGPEFSYTWTTNDGNIVSGANTPTPTINAPGTYTLTILNTTTNCEEMDEVVVDQNDIEADLDDPPFLDCVPGFLTLDGSGSTSGNNITYQWSTIGGNITNQNGTQATVDAPGTYTLTVVYDDGVNVCTDEATVQVLEDPNEPVAFAFDEVLPCEPSAIQLDGSGSSQGSIFSYLWTTPNGVITAGETTLFPTVAAPGSYIITVTNLLTGCTADYDVFVTADQTLPIAIANVFGTLSCNQTQLTIDGTGSSEGSDFTYSWTTVGGNIVSEENTLYPIVDAEGDYTLVVTDLSNGCSDQTTVLVQDNSFNPNAEIDTPDELTCVVESVVLDGSGSDQGADYTYSWSTTNGQIEGPADGIEVTVSAPGDYTLVVVNTANNCEESATVTVAENTIPPFAEAGIADPLGCGDSSTFLDGSASSSSNDDTYTYQWTTTNGNILNGATTFSPEVNALGTYILEVTNTITGCTATDEVLVEGDADTPVVSLVVSDTLDCVTDVVTVDASGSSQGGDYTFAWSTTDGNITAGANTLQPAVDEPGTYTLAITNVNNNCTTDQSITVLEDVQAPVATIGVPGQLDCNNATVDLDATASTPAGNIHYQWTTADGNIISGAITGTPTVGQAGTYQLEVVNTSNGCSAMTSTLVSQDTLAPTVAIENPATLNCNVVQTTLDASGSSQGGAYSYLWTSTDGNILNGNTTLNPEVDAPGMYQLAVSNADNGCSSSSMVTVAQDTLAPTVVAGDDTELNCSNPTQLIGSAATSSGPQFTYAWTSPDGQFAGATDTLTATVNAAGLYILEVQDTVNFCSASDTLSVSEDFAAPTAIIASPDLLTCTDSLVALDATASSSGMNISYAWSSANGSIVSGQNTAQPTVSQAGDYQLIILNNENGCSDTTTTVVSQDENFPEALIAEPDLLTCVNLSVTLNGTANSQSGNFDFLWTSTDGNFTAGTNSLQPTVDASGTYFLQVTDLDNNCQALAAVEVILDDEEPVTTIMTPQVLTCALTEQSLQADNPDAAGNYTYQWSTLDGNIVGGEESENPSVDAPGTYELLVTNTDNGCTLLTDVSVTENVVPPVLAIGTPAELNCSLTSQTLDATGSDMGLGFQFEWTTPDGEITADATTPEPTIAGPGTYSLLLTNTDNGCSSVDQVVVTEDVQIPTVVVNEADELTCTTTSVTLSSAGTDTGPNFELAWSTMDGNLTSATDIPDPTAAAPGFYQLLVTNTQNGCVDSSGVAISQDTLSPTVSLAEPAVLTCATLTTSLDASASTTQGAPVYQWLTMDGQLDSGEDSATPGVSAPGTYTLSLTDTDNGCMSMGELTVGQDTIQPVASIAPAEVLTCGMTAVSLDASASSTLGDFTFTWSTPDGNIVGANDELLAQVDSPGEYVFAIENEDNGCSNSTSMQVSQDTISPTISIATPSLLDCQLTALNLDATGSSEGSVFMINWTTLDGQIESGANTLMPVINEPGEYELVILNTDNGCSNSASISVEQDDDVPVVSVAEPETLTCVLPAISLDAGTSSMGDPFTINWTTADGQIQEGANTLNPVIVEPGTYVLSILNTDNQCENSTSVTVLENTVTPVADAGPDFTLSCFTMTSSLDGSGSSQNGPYTYAWTALDGMILDGEQSLDPTIDGPGVFELVITNTENGCIDNDLVTVDQDIPVATVSTAEPLCYGDPGSLLVESVVGGTAPYVYSVNNGQSFQATSTFGNLPAGEYELVVQDLNGCEYLETVVIDQPDSLVVVITEPEVVIQLGDSHAIFAQVNVPVEDLTTVFWEHNGSLSCTDCLTPIARPLETTVYRVTVQNANGCTDEATLRLFVENDRAVYIPNAFSPDGDGQNDIFMIFARLGVVEKVRQFEVYNRWGEPVFSAFDFQPNDPSAGWDGIFRGQPVNPAVYVYFAEVEYADGTVEILKGDVAVVR